MKQEEEEKTALTAEEDLMKNLNLGGVPLNLNPPPKMVAPGGAKVNKNGVLGSAKNGGIKDKPAVVMKSG
jgi:hypothetical protein